LERVGILKFFDIQHFDRSNEVNACVNFLLTCLHGVYLWLDMIIYIDTYLIARITGLPTQRKDPNLLFVDNKTNKTMSEEMREKFYIVIGVCSLDVLRICDPTVRIAT